MSIRGRVPKKPKGKDEPKMVHIVANLTYAEQMKIRAAVEKEGITTSEWVRACLLANL